LALGYCLLAIGYWLPALGSWLLAIAYWLLALGYWLLPRTQSSQLETPSPAPRFRDNSFVLYSPQKPDFASKVKKGALRLVQSTLNAFIISRFFQKSRRKNAHFEGKIDPFRPFFSLFPAFSGTWPLRRIFASPTALSRPFDPDAPGRRPDQTRMVFSIG
jgi:hypothetical protein